MLQRWHHNILNVPAHQFFLLAFAVRVLFVCYGLVQDSYLAVKYTDIDYAVYSDGARYLHDGQSPYQRSTYRYTPLLATLLLPNHCIHSILQAIVPSGVQSQLGASVLTNLSQLYGKLLFCCFDLVYSWTVYQLLGILYLPSDSSKPQQASSAHVRYALLLSLFNPLSLTISTRGNADTIITTLCTLVLLLLYKRQYVAAAVTYSLAIHLKIYPIIYAPSVYLWIAARARTEGRQKSAVSSSHGNYLVTQVKLAVSPPYIDKLLFTFMMILTLAMLTAYYYHQYGYEFLYHTYIYHTVRNDHRHNFSVWFYTIYQAVVQDEAAASTTYLPSGMATFLPQCIAMLVITLYRYQSLPQCWFLLTLVFTTFNKVVTSQYFLWWMAYLPLALPLILQQCQRHRSYGAMWLSATVLWFLTEFHWLYWGYQIEFLGQSGFIGMYAASLLFAGVNVVLIVMLVGLR